MNQVPFPRPEAAARDRVGAARCGRLTGFHLRRYSLRAVRVGLAVLLGATWAAVGLVAAAHVAYAAPDPGSPESFSVIVDGIRAWLIGILVAVATLFLTIGGLRYVAANGDPGEVEKAKLALRSAAIGYALAMLAPLIVIIVDGWVP